jgi:hypothetical protein
MLSATVTASSDALKSPGRLLQGCLSVACLSPGKKNIANFPKKL